MAKRKRTNNNLQNITQKTKYRATKISLKTGGELRCSGRVRNFCSTCGTQSVTLVTNPVISYQYFQHHIQNCKLSITGCCTLVNFVQN